MTPFRGAASSAAEAGLTPTPMRKAAHLFGADQVGFAELDRRWVYSRYFDSETKKDYPIKFSDGPVTNSTTILFASKMGHGLSRKR